MEFIVSRSSVYDNNIKPCDGAKQDIVRVVKTIRGNLEKKYWSIEINSLEDLIKFIDTYGDVVLLENSDGYYEIEIYDNYRE